MGGKDVVAAKCIKCHPVSGGKGLCGLVSTDNHTAVCAACHADACDSSCPAARVLGDENPRLEQLRDFRDNVLANSALGQKIINSYYNNADSINAALEENPKLKAFTLKALQSFIPVLDLFL